MLLSTTREQGRALLATVTVDQVKVLVEIAYNLTRLADLGPDLRFIKYLGSRKHTLRYKKSFVRKYPARVFTVLSKFKEELSEL